jgi:hypothetical protein
MLLGLMVTGRISKAPQAHGDDMRPLPGEGQLKKTSLIPVRLRAALRSPESLP